MDNQDPFVKNVSPGSSSFDVNRFKGLLNTLKQQRQEVKRSPGPQAKNTDQFSGK